MKILRLRLLIGSGSIRTKEGLGVSFIIIFSSFGFILKGIDTGGREYLFFCFFSYLYYYVVYIVVIVINNFLSNVAFIFYQFISFRSLVKKLDFGV